MTISPTRTKILMKRASAPMLVKLHGPPLSQWDPTRHVTT
uniref:Uncharacterized protein n=1 Tax=Anguilla anguilla TaxID=7936 RepID=A0A0E9VK76_ANGAN